MNYHAAQICGTSFDDDGIVVRGCGFCAMDHIRSNIEYEIRKTNPSFCLMAKRL